MRIVIVGALAWGIAPIGCGNSDDDGTTGAGSDTDASTSAGESAGPADDGSGGADETSNASAADDDGGSEIACRVLPNRCEAACMEANADALIGCDLQGWVQTLPADVAMALLDCITGCDGDPSDDAAGCVGQASPSDCACQDACYADNLTAEQLPGAIEIADCYDTAVSAACG